MNSPGSREAMQSAGRSRPYLAVVGSINADLSLRVDRLPLPGETVLGDGGTLSPGGKGANQAVAAARQGCPTIMVSAVGDDPHAEAALELLRDAEVDLNHVVVLPGLPTGLAVVTVDSHAENNIVVVSGANAHVSPAVLEGAFPAVSRAAVVVAQGEVPAETMDLLARRLPEHVRFVLNLAPVIAVQPSTIRRADPLIVNEHEAVQVLAGLGEAGAAESGDPVEGGKRLAKRLRAQGPASVVVTLGRHGAVSADDGGTRHVPARPVAAVDTTGAGDAFVGALAAALVRGETLAEAVESGTEVAALAVTKRGAQASYPWRDGAAGRGSDR